MRVLYFFLLVISVTFVHAESDVFRCKSKDGGVIFQQIACSDDQVTGNGIQHESWRTLRSMSAEGISILSRLGADVESIKECKSAVKDYHKRLDAMKNSIKGLKISYPQIAQAHGYLYECSVCKTSAEAYCRSADKALDAAMEDLMKY